MYRNNRPQGQGSISQGWLNWAGAAGLNTVLDVQRNGSPLGIMMVILLSKWPHLKAFP